MNRPTGRILSVLLAAVLILGMAPLAASAAVGDKFNQIDYSYKVLSEDTEAKTGTVALTKNNNAGMISASTPPAVLRYSITYAVTEIGANAYENSLNLTSIRIQEGTKVFGAAVFSGCAALQRVTLPSTATEIGDNLFQNCIRLTDIEFLGTTPPNFGNDLFSGVTGPVTITVPKGSQAAYELALSGLLPAGSEVEALKSSVATISAGSLAGKSLAGDNFNGGSSPINSTALTVTIPAEDSANAALLLTKDDAEATIKYVVGFYTPLDAAAY